LGSDGMHYQDLTRENGKRKRMDKQRQEIIHYKLLTAIQRSEDGSKR